MIRLVPLPIAERIQPGDDLVALLAAAVVAAGEELQSGDVLVVAQKPISKAEGRIVDLADVEPSAEALAIGLANRVVPDGQARTAAEELAHDLAALPQGCLRADRLSAMRQWGHSEAEAMDVEFGSLSQVAAESVAGARRFADGAGRHGSPA